MKKVRKIFKDNIKIVVAFIIGILLSTISVSGAILYSSSNVIFDNTNSGLISTNVQNTLNELCTESKKCSNTIYKSDENTVWSSNQNISSFTEGVDYVRNREELTYHEKSSKVYLKFRIANNIVTEGYVCFIVTSEMLITDPQMTVGEYCLKAGDGGASFLENTKTIYKAFGSSCSVNPYTTTPSSPFTCGYANGTVYVYATSDGRVDASTGVWSCWFYGDNNYYCGTD